MRKQPGSKRQDHSPPSLFGGSLAYWTPNPPGPCGLQDKPPRGPPHTEGRCVRVRGWPRGVLSIRPLGSSEVISSESKKPAETTVAGLPVAFQRHAGWSEPLEQAWLSAGGLQSWFSVLSRAVLLLAVLLSHGDAGSPCAPARAPVDLLSSMISYLDSENLRVLPPRSSSSSASGALANSFGMTHPITSSPQGRWTSSLEQRRICFQRRA